jgi:putative NADH-flavin reductase
MRLLIFGASGQTGRELVRQALERQHAVTAFVRQPTMLSASPSLRITQGDVADAAAVEAAMPNHEAVVSVLGVGVPLRSDPAVVAGIRHIVQSMEKHGLRRLLYLSFIGVAESRAAVGFVLRYIAPIPLRAEIADHEAKEWIVRQTRLDWTIVRPPKLTNGPRTGTYRSGENIQTWAPVPTLSRADVAEFMLEELERPTYVRAAPRLLR